MKVAKIFGVLFIVIGLLFAILGAISYMVFLAEKDELIYTNAQIVRIDERKTGDPEFPTEYTAYVELEVNGEKITAELNTYKPSFKTGKQIKVCYFENDVQTVYEQGSENFFILFSLCGVIFAALGAILTFKLSKRLT